MSAERDALDRTVANLAAALRKKRTAPDHWEGRLSSSALSTATAVVALSLADRNAESKHRGLIDAGVRWLVDHQNTDGGWGDTTLSFSNLSTTSLCWAALHRPGGSGGSGGPGAAGGAGGADGGEDTAIRRAEEWIRARVGGLTANRLVDAIVQLYGKDRTFSVPILTTLALTGRLGDDAAVWRHIPQLPFEIAACPHQWFQWLQLPVVSYALPALVALGYVRHRRGPARNPALRLIRAAATERSLRTLRRSQPASGGYLEATPLTSFVVMSLVGAGLTNHPTVEHGVRFLVDSARDDGSWPIDTNLATWVTTLAVNAGGCAVAADEQPAIAEWLLAQQIRHEHPFTHAAPGGWAWTHLSGGVPDADDTAGALLALRRLAGATPRARAAAEAGVRWLVGLQNRDGGIPTFCRGWGALPFDCSAPDLTAHAIQAWSAWHTALPPALAFEVDAAAARALHYLSGSQAGDGSWTPLWFGNQHTRDEANPTYGTARVLPSLSTPLVANRSAAQRIRRRGLSWLLGAQNPDGGWGGGAGAPSSIEETGVALQACARSVAAGEFPEILDAACRGVRWLIAATDEGRRTTPAPVGLYFARLWYFEETYPIVFGLAGLTAMQALADRGHNLIPEGAWLGARGKRGTAPFS